MNALDHFAAAALPALIAANPDDAPEQLAADAYLIAFAMLNERAKRAEQPITERIAA